MKTNVAPRRIGDRIKRARWDAGLSQQKLADKAGTTRHNIMRWESGKNEPRLRFIRAIAEATGKPVEFFTDDDEEPHQMALLSHTEMLRALAPLASVLRQAERLAKNETGERVQS